MTVVHLPGSGWRKQKPTSVPFPKGMKVTLASCPGPTGIVQGMRRNRVLVRWNGLNYTGRHRPAALLPVNRREVSVGVSFMDDDDPPEEPFKEFGPGAQVFLQGRGPLGTVQRVEPDGRVAVIWANSHCTTRHQPSTLILAEPAPVDDEDADSKEEL